MSKAERPLVIVDVDLTIYDTFAQPPRLIDGTRLLLESLGKTAEVHLWSAGGGQYAQKIAEECGVNDLVQGYHDKPEHPPTEESAIQILGRKAILQIDDDLSERIPGWNFVLANAMRERYGDY